MTHCNTVDALCLYQSNQLFHNQSQNVFQLLDGRCEICLEALKEEQPTTQNNVHVNIVTYLHVTLKQASLALHIKKSNLAGLN